MKKIGIIVLILTFYCMSHSQIPQVITTEYYSLNKKYKVIVKGLAYEGFVDKQEITFKDQKDSVRWKKNEFIWSVPIISNRGITALLSKDIRFFDIKGIELGLYNVDQILENFWTDCADCSPAHFFSPDGNYYYTLIGNQNVIRLLCLTTKGKEMWRFELLRDNPIHSSISIELFPFNNGILAYYSLGAASGKNVCYLINVSGEVIRTYENNLPTRWRPIIDTSKNEFSLYFGDTLKTYSLQSGSFVKSKIRNNKLNIK